MKTKIDWLIKKPTLFSITGPIVILISLIYLIYLIAYENGGELTSVALVLILLASAILIAFDRVFIKFFSYKIISVIEAIGSIATFIYFRN